MSGPGRSRQELLRRLYTYRDHERAAVRSLPDGARILDLGCSEGANLPGLMQGGRRVFGLDPSLARLARARRLCPVAAGDGERSPFRDGSFDLVYVSHVLHHAQHRRMIREIHRLLKPGGILFLIESFENHPVMRLARALYPRWGSDPVRSRFWFDELRDDLTGAGFRIRAGEQFNLLYWIWEVPQLWLRPMELLIPLVLRAELVMARRWRRHSAHGFLVAEKGGGRPEVPPRA